MDDEVHVVFRGTLVEIIVAAVLELYRQFYSYETVKAVLYVRPQKALYGFLKSTLLVYEKLVQDIEAYGFRINPFKTSVANKMVAGKQLTVFKVKKMIQRIELEYGDIQGSRGKRQDYLVMLQDYSILGEVHISMEEYLRGVIGDFPDKISETT